MSRLSEFVGVERERFSAEDGNKFVMSFSQISRYYAFLEIVLKRYKDVSARFVANTSALQDCVLPGTHPLTGRSWDIYEENTKLTIELHLEIESFYLFGKILLDKIARSLEFYFGQVRKKPLSSHDDLVKNFVSFAEQKALALPPDFRELAADLKRDVSDYRDYEIAHQNSPKRMTGTAFDMEGNTRIMGTKLYPTDRDQQRESKILDDLMKDIDRYIDQTIEIVKSNQSRTKLTTESRR